MNTVMMAATISPKTVSVVATFLCRDRPFCFPSASCSIFIHHIRPLEAVV